MQSEELGLDPDVKVKTELLTDSLCEASAVGNDDDDGGEGVMGDPLYDPNNDVDGDVRRGEEKGNGDSRRRNLPLQNHQVRPVISQWREPGGQEEVLSNVEFTRWRHLLWCCNSKCAACARNISDIILP